uniref:Uncharacterized protein n=1 Tax=Plectus sambesii TaxID=2011161 RepID=A0A914XD23_9BILA
MLFIPGTIAASTYALGKECEDEKWKLEQQMAQPVTYEDVLEKLDNDALDLISADEKKLRKEAKRINSIQQKIHKKEREYMELEKELGEGELIEAALVEEKLEKAEKKLIKMQSCDEDKTPVKEKIVEVFHDAKERIKDAVDNVAHLVSANDKEPKTHERVIEMGAEPAGGISTITFVDDPKESRKQKKLRAAAKHIEEMRTELSKQRATMMHEDDEILRKEMKKIEDLQQLLEEEVRKYAVIEADLIDEVQYEAKLREEAQKLQELQLVE